MSETTNESLLEKLEWLVETADVARVLTEPLIASLRTLLQVSANELGTDEASVLIRDGDGGDLRFLCAIGQVADELLNIRIPAGKGVAGFVLSSGQPMAVSDAGEEDVFFPDVDKKTGYSTQTILAVPLSHGNEILGVLEYVNRKGSPPFESYTSEEMDRAILFAEAVAALVSAYHSAKLFREVTKWVFNGEGPKDVAVVREWLAGIRESDEHCEMIELAVLIRQLSKRGGAVRTLCRELLESMLRFTEGEHGAVYAGGGHMGL